MKKHLLLSLAVILSALLNASAQGGGGMGGGMGGMRRGGMMGGAPSGPNLGGSMAKIFGDHTSFSATMEYQVKDTSGQPLNSSGKLAFDHGKSRFEVDTAKSAGSRITPDQAAQMKTMGMDQMVLISVPEKKVAYMVYPGLKAYVENELKDADTGKPDQFKIETTELGKETLDGHACVKNKVVVTDDKGAKHESTVWNATDLKNFPVKIESTENGATTTMLFKDLKLDKVEAAQFDPPAGATKYNDMMSMMLQEMMKRRGGGQ